VELPAIRFALLPAALGAFGVIASAPSICLRAYLPESVSVGGVVIGAISPQNIELKSPRNAA
jgi:hypothetical protein